ncbi:hypothetical protein CR513_17919, partial [Mucuna pruriens]
MKKHICKWKGRVSNMLSEKTKARREKCSKKVHFRNEKFPTLRKSKLLRPGHRPFPMLHKINDNAYVLNMPPRI